MNFDANNQTNNDTFDAPKEQKIKNSCPIYWYVLLFVLVAIIMIIFLSGAPLSSTHSSQSVKVDKDYILDNRSPSVTSNMYGDWLIACILTMILLALDCIMIFVRRNRPLQKGESMISLLPITCIVVLYICSFGMDNSSRDFTSGGGIQVSNGTSYECTLWFFAIIALLFICSIVTKKIIKFRKE